MHRSVITLASLLLAAGSIHAADPRPDRSGVARTQFTSAVRNREPVDNLTEFNDGTAGRVYCFTELSNMSGQFVTQSWEYRGEIMSTTRFRVDGPHSRIWSSRLLTPDRPGSWTVLVLSASGEVLAERTLDYNTQDPVF
jgi:hypothetical protein